MKKLIAILALGLLAGTSMAYAAPVVVDFEGLADSTLLSNQIVGLTFTNAQVLAAGVSLNELEFPPFSGTNVAVDVSGNLIVNFSSLVYSVSARITYLTPITLTAFDSGLSAVATANSLFAANMALSGAPGSSPNELITVSWSSGISRVRFAGGANGSSFVIDNLSYETERAAVPEPATLGLLGLGLVAVGFAHRRKAQAKKAATASRPTAPGT